MYLPEKGGGVQNDALRINKGNDALHGKIITHPDLTKYTCRVGLSRVLKRIFVEALNIQINHECEIQLHNQHTSDETNII